MMTRAPVQEPVRGTERLRLGIILTTGFSMHKLGGPELGVIQSLLGRELDVNP